MSTFRDLYELVMVKYGAGRLGGGCCMGELLG